MRPVQPTLEGVVEPPQIEMVVERVAATVADWTMSIPQIVVLPKRQVTFRFEDFDLANLEAINVRPIEDGLVIQTLRTEARIYLAKATNEQLEERPEDYLVRYLIERNEIDYDAHADLLYKLAGQVVGRLRTYLDADAEVENALLRHGRQLADFVFAQMMQHYKETQLGEEDYEVKVTRGFTLIQPPPLNVSGGQHARDFRQSVAPLSDTRRQVFYGFKRCCCSLQKFDSDPERKFAVAVDADPSVERWMRPGREQIRIEYKSGEGYEPDFVVETTSRMLLCEVKASNELDDPVVRAKAAAAVKWCKAATDHATSNDGKPWRYLLIPDDQVTGNATLDGLAAKFSR
jgi:type III restriction enzyme